MRVIYAHRINLGFYFNQKKKVLDSLGMHRIYSYAPGLKYI